MAGVYCHEGFIVVVRYERRDEEQTVSIYQIPVELNGCCDAIPIKSEVLLGAIRPKY